MNIDLQNICDLVEQLGQSAHAEDMSVLEDQDKDIKIDLDYKLHERLSTYLLDRYDYPVLSEESDSFDFASHDGYYWIVDPIDGSLNHSRGIPFSCISIALWRGAYPILGVLYDIYDESIFFGRVGEDNDNSHRYAHLNGERIATATTDHPADGVLATGFPSRRDYDAQSLHRFISKVQQWKKVRLFGSAALSLAWVACGKVDAYVEEDIRIWDVAAGLAIVKAAGGNIYCQANRRKNFVTAVGANQNLHTDKVLC